MPKKRLTRTASGKRERQQVCQYRLRHRASAQNQLPQKSPRTRSGAPKSTFVPTKSIHADLAIVLPDCTESRREDAEADVVLLTSTLSKAQDFNSLTKRDSSGFPVPAFKNSPRNAHSVSHELERVLDFDEADAESDSKGTAPFARVEPETTPQQRRVVGTFRPPSVEIYAMSSLNAELTKAKKELTAVTANLTRISQEYEEATQLVVKMEGEKTMLEEQLVECETVYHLLLWNAREDANVLRAKLEEARRKLIGASSAVRLDNPYSFWGILRGVKRFCNI
ncbi:hypothetical protein BV898_04890 [Hypsibius exemplaris]|uniref:Uncharacterized protein n=1 Tax=Hypsibius exemplaris TaxID=2072580 RepID=A0A1W0X0V2_HYPEX|nr:hypothetical protein BV898_04890 [Hypsibius exemplaris]